ncbi:MAG: GNAT family N-acetyltransferase [Candidatus Bathyarchaeia archaeon]
MLTVQRYFQLKPVTWRQHFLFNLLNFLYFRKRDYREGFSIESNPLFVFTVIPYIVFSEVYFFRQRRYFVTVKQQIVGVFALEERTRVLYISNVAISPFYRRIGVATYLLDHAAALARQLDKSILELSVNKVNTPALKLYRKYGFTKKKARINSYILRKDVGSAL